MLPMPAKTPFAACGATVATAAAAPRVVRSAPWSDSRSATGSSAAACSRDTQRGLRGGRGPRAVAESVDDEHPLLSVRRLHRPRVAATSSPGIGNAYRRRTDAGGGGGPAAPHTCEPHHRADVRSASRCRGSTRAAKCDPSPMPGLPAVECPSRMLARDVLHSRSVVDRDHFDADDARRWQRAAPAVCRPRACLTRLVAGLRDDDGRARSATASSIDRRRASATRCAPRLRDLAAFLDDDLARVICQRVIVTRVPFRARLELELVGQPPRAAEAEAQARSRS